LSLSVINSMFENLNSAHQKCMNPLVAEATKLFHNGAKYPMEHVDYRISLFIFGLQWL